MSGSRPHLVKSARRVMEVLEYFDYDRSSATVTEISRTLEYPQSSTSELLRCLTELGFLYYNRSRRTYSPTARVSLLGAWVEPGLFRDGRAFAAVDRIAEKTGETVVISSGGPSYMVYYIHVVQGTNAGAISAHAGECEQLLRSPQGELLVASYPDQQIHSALHRINAVETEPEHRFVPSQKFAALQILRQRGWTVASQGHGPDKGAVAVLLPRRRGGNRLVLSVLGTNEVIEQRGDEILALLMEEREQLMSGVLEFPIADPLHYQVSAYDRPPAAFMATA